MRCQVSCIVVRIDILDNIERYRIDDCDLVCPKASHQRIIARLGKSHIICNRDGGNIYYHAVGVSLEY